GCGESRSSAERNGVRVSGGRGRLLPPPRGFEMRRAYSRSRMPTSGAVAGSDVAGPGEAGRVLSGSFWARSSAGKRRLCWIEVSFKRGSMRLKRAHLEPSWLVKALRWIGPLVLVLGALAVAPGQSAAAVYPVFPDMGSPQAVEIAERILSWQLPHGGWGKNLPIADRRWTPGTPKSSQ